jgi:hypothetical protein
MNVAAILAVLLQASETTGDPVSDGVLGAVVGIMFLVGVVWTIKRLRGHKPVDRKMSIRLNEDSFERLPESLQRR